MTEVSINFLRHKRRRIERAQALDKRILQGMVAFFGVIFLLSVGMFVYWQRLRTQVADVREQQKAQERIISQASQDEAQYLLFTARLDSISEILSTRSSKKETMDFLSLITRPNVSFDRISYDGVTRELIFRVQAKDVFAVESFLKRMNEPEVKQRLSNVSVSDIRRDELATYVLDMKVVLVGAPDTKEEKKGRS